MAFRNGLLENRERGSRSLQTDPFVRGLPQSIGQILCHPVQGEVGGEVVGCHAVGHSFYDSAPRSAAGENRDGGGAIKFPGIDHAQCFGKRRGLHPADEVVDELHHSSRANRAQVQHVATEHRKHWAGVIEGLGRASDKENQFSRRGMRFGAGNGRIQESAAALGRFGGKLCNPIPAQGAGFDQD